MSDEPWDWTKVPDASVRELVRQGELQLADILAIAIAADQRATTQASILAGFGGVLLAAAATLAATSIGIPTFGSIAVSGAGIMVAAFVSGLAAKPIRFFASGYEPQKLLVAAADEMWLLRFVAEDIQMRIAENRTVLDRTANLTILSTRIAFISVVLGVGVYVGARLI